MSLGGGSFTTQNKILPGSYINFISVAKANANLSDRGIATMPLQLDWGVDNSVFEVTNEDFQKNSLKIFGYDYTHDKMKGLRDLFLNLKTLYAYRLNSGLKAECTFATAKHSGTRGNNLKVVITVNADDADKFDVSLYLDTNLIETQTVETSAELVDNDWVDWKKNSVLAATTGLNLEGGTNGTVDGTAYQTYFDRIEPYTYNVMGVPTTDSTIKGLAVNFVKRMRDEIGAKFQLVIYDKEADYEGVINVVNAVTAETNFGVESLVYFVTGLEAACEVNKSCLNRKYDGEFVVGVDYTQSQLEAAIKAGKFMLHRVGNDIRVLSDINSLVTTSDTKGDIFKDNQTIRVADQIANDIATIFNTKYLGVVPNDASGRVSLWSDIVKHHEQLQEIRAIENFKDADVVVLQGNSNRAVVVQDAITVVAAMAQLYMTVEIA